MEDACEKASTTCPDDEASTHLFQCYRHGIRLVEACKKERCVDAGFAKDDFCLYGPV
jgi:hypothetical protein